MKSRLRLGLFSLLFLAVCAAALTEGVGGEADLIDQDSLWVAGARGVAGIPGFFRPAAGPGWALVGDAGDATPGVTVTVAAATATNEPSDADDEGRTTTPAPTVGGPAPPPRGGRVGIGEA